MEKLCQYTPCSKQYDGWPTSKYCSNSCKYKAKYRRHNELSGSCEECGNPTNKTGTRQNRFCSNECYKFHLNKEYKAQDNHKICRKCKKEKHLDEFNNNSNRDANKSSYCRECDREKSRTWYSKQKEYKPYAQTRAAHQKRRTQLHKEKLDQIKIDSGCVDCGYNKNPNHLDFDHVRGTKVQNLSTMAGRWSWVKIQEELDKCEVRCAFCHRDITLERQQNI